jgi:mannose-6-phosphate isomerase-like protein (cupin superfamily)
MRHAVPQRSTRLLGLVTTITLLGVGAIWPAPSAEIALGSGSVTGAVTVATDHDRIARHSPSRLPPRGGDERVSMGRRDRAQVRPLVALSLLTTPTAPGASLVAERLTYATGATMSVRRHTQIRVIVPKTGSLEARIDGVAFLDRRWPAGSLLAAEPYRVEGVIDLHPGDLLAVPAETAFSVRNPGEVPTVSLELSLQLTLPLTPMTDHTGDVPGAIRSERLAATIAMAPGAPVELSVGRTVLAQDGSIVADSTAGPVVLVVERGLLGGTRDGQGVERAPGEVELVPRGALATLHSTGEAPLAMLLLTIAPVESDTAA